LPEAKSFAECFLSGTRPLPGARPGGTRQIKASGKVIFAGCPALGKVQPSAKNSLCRVLGTRQNMAAGKGGRRDGRAFAGCHAVRHSIKNFFLKKYTFAGCLLSWHPTKASLADALGGTRQIIIFFCFFPQFFSGPCYSKQISISKF
jgi:hypothetical protein